LAKRKRIFVDTSAWYALQIIDDANHETAKEILHELLPKCESLITSNHVIGETYTLLRTFKGYSEARRFLDILRQSPRVVEYFAGKEIQREAFAFDKHFVVAGFTRIEINVPV